MASTVNTNVINLELSSEQNEFITEALDGKNILVDACIGSGKTTSIQQLCNAFPPDKRILYLTYNRLLKLDAQAKIKSSNTTVTNYHGFAMGVLRKANITCGIPELVYRKDTVALHNDLLLRAPAGKRITPKDNIVSNLNRRGVTVLNRDAQAPRMVLE